MAERSIQRVLRQHLQTERLLGLDAVPLGDASELRDVMAGKAVAASAPHPADHAPAQPAAPAQPPRAEDGAASRHSLASPAGAPAMPATAPVGGTGSPLFGGDEAGSRRPVLARRSGPGLPREVKLGILNDLDQKEVRGCTKCPLHAGRTQTVFGEGDPDSEILFIGEGPGQTEDELGRPFVGRAGELLDKMIVAMGLQRTQVYIANVVKCRPPNNRTPTPIEVETCWDYLRRQIETIQPKVIVTLGGPATKKLVNTEKGITALRGVWQMVNISPGAPAVPLMPTFHPAYLLRSYTPDNRRKVWSDLQKVMELVRSA